MIKFLLCLLFSILTVFSFSQKTNIQGINSNPLDIINKVITYGIENRNTFDGSCKVGYVQGESYFSFRKFSNKFPNIFVSYSALGRSATEGGILRNIKFVNSGNFKTKIIVANWENFDKNHAGSGTFQLSVLDENYPNKLYVGISGYNWSYYINIELKENDFQDIVTLLDYSTLSQEAGNKIIGKSSKILNIDDIDKSISFKEVELNSGGNISYYLEEDAEEDTDFLFIRINNSKKVFKFFIQSDDFSVNNFNFHINNWEYDKKGKCKRIDYRVTLKLKNQAPVFKVQKISETPYCAG